jgi:hypothetical protein
MPVRRGNNNNPKGINQYTKMKEAAAKKLNERISVNQTITPATGHDEVPAATTNENEQQGAN